ncbi:hypothetical protein ACKWTF_014528 [Chironomus riparius]
MKMSTKHIFATLNVILALLVRFSTQYLHNHNNTYQSRSLWNIETNLIDFGDDSDENLLAFNPCLVHYCPKGMECIIAPSNVPKCICQRRCVIYNKRKRRHVCGSDGIIYDNFCELYRAACNAQEEIIISSMDSCVRSQQQKLQCSSDEYALMKDNLLLFHHQNMVYLQHGDDDHLVHRMEYLVSIIFSHYDQNNDGLVERDELQFMWNTMDMHHVSNDSNCTLMDMLIYDDNNEDGVLTITEFNDAFHRISETVVRQTTQLNHIHLDSSLQFNHLVVRIGDNVEIKCDINGPQTNIIWKRFGYDLSLVNNSTDDDDDEIKLMQDGGLYITNVQMRHSGNYTCQAAIDPQVIQTHIVTVHMQPTIVITPREQSRRPGERAEILCHAIGGMQSQIEWLKNDKPLEPEYGRKYTIAGNGTSLMINRLDYPDTGSYTCIAGTVKSQVSTIVVQSDPIPLAMHRDEKIFIFHDDGISIYSTNLCQLVHRINPLDTILRTNETVCHRYAQKCSWGTAVGIDGTDGSDGLIYIAQPMMDRILVLSMLQHIVLETIRTDTTPMELFHVPAHDQLWVVNYNLHREGTIKADPAKTLQMIPDVRMAHVKHRAVHPSESTMQVNGDIMQFYLPPVNALPHLYDYRYGFVTHHQQRGFWKLDLELMRYEKYVDLSIYDCIPEFIKIGGLYGFIVVSCMEPALHHPTGQIVLDTITSTIISIKADLIGIPYFSPDSRHVITVSHRHDTVLISVQQVTLAGLNFAFDVETTLNISDITFVKSSVSMNFDVYATTDKSEILYLSLETGKVETITGVGEPAINTWFNGGRKIKESDLTANLIASPSKDAFYIISTRTRNITCQVDNLENPNEIVWSRAD